MSTRNALAIAVLFTLGSDVALAADTTGKDGKSAKLTDSPTYKEIQRQGNRIGDDISKNIGQAFRNANEGFKKRMETDKERK